MENIYGAMGYYFHQILERAFTYTVIVVIFCYHVIFDKDLLCTCQNLPRDCSFYMVMPTFIILMALLWADKRFHRTCCYSRGASWLAVFRLFDSVIVALVWNVSVLVEGDWMVCCFDDSLRNVSCIDKYHRTDADNRFIIEKKNYSRIIGLSLLLCVVSLAFAVSLLRRRFLDDRVLWADIVLQKEEKMVTERLEARAEEEMKTRLDAHIRRGQWQQCLSVGDELIWAYTRRRSPTEGAYLINETDPLLGPTASASSTYT